MATSNRSIKYEEQADLEGTVNMTSPKITETDSSVVVDINSPDSKASTHHSDSSRKSTLDEPVFDSIVTTDKVTLEQRLLLLLRSTQTCLHSFQRPKAN